LSRLPHDVLRMLEAPRSLGQLAEALTVTDARVLWYLQKLRDVGPPPPDRLVPAMLDV